MLFLLHGLSHKEVKAQISYLAPDALLLILEERQERWRARVPGCLLNRGNGNPEISQREYPIQLIQLGSGVAAVSILIPHRRREQSDPVIVEQRILSDREERSDLMRRVIYGIIDFHGTLIVALDYGVYSIVLNMKS